MINVTEQGEYNAFTGLLSSKNYFAFSVSEEVVRRCTSCLSVYAVLIHTVDLQLELDVFHLPSITETQCENDFMNGITIISTYLLDRFLNPIHHQGEVQ